MSANLLHQLRQSGIRLQPRGDRLHVEAAPGAVTPELRLILTEHKADLLAALSGDALRARLQRIAAADLIDANLVHTLPEADVLDCAGLPDETLRATLRGFRDDDLRERGKRPADETAAALCRSCGPVWLHPSIAAVVPMTAGWPRLLGCPWCHVRNRRAIPRPLVTCGECQHFERDAINPDGGMGRCGAGCNPARPWPSVQHQCATYSPAKEQT
jgi:hypothetical protein